MEQKKKNQVSWLDILMSRIKSWNLKQLKVLIKADTNWSLEAIKASISKLSTPETNVVIIHSWVWNITEWDVLMVEWSNAILVWFNVWVANSAKNMIDKTKIEFINSKVIYHITERIEKIITWMLDPKEVETVLCHAKVGWIFYTDKKFIITWLILEEEDSKIENNTLVRVIRKDKKISDWKITSLKSWVEEVKELTWPIECWVRYESKKLNIEIWDIFEVYKIEIQK
jgi:translation initiation factor IF-2